MTSKVIIRIGEKSDQIEKENNKIAINNTQPYHENTDSNAKDVSFAPVAPDSPLEYPVNINTKEVIKQTITVSTNGPTIATKPSEAA